MHVTHIYFVHFVVQCCWLPGDSNKCLCLFVCMSVRETTACECVCVCHICVCVCVVHACVLEGYKKLKSTLQDLMLTVKTIT